MKGNLSKAFIGHINNVSIRIKLLLFFLLLSIIPFFAMTLINYKVVSSEIRKQILYSADQVFKDSASMIKKKLDGVLETSTSICLNEPIIQKVLKSKPLDYFEDTLQQNIDYNYINKFIKSMENISNVNRVALYIQNTYFFANQNVNFYNINDIESTPWYTEIIEDNRQINWFPSSYFHETKFGKNVICAIRKVRNLDNLPELLAVVRIDVDLSQISEIIDHAIITPDSKVIMINSKNELICAASNTDDIISGDPSLDYDKINKLYSNSQLWYTITMSDNKMFMKSSNIPDTDWKMILLIPYTDLLSFSNKSRNGMAVVAIITSVVACGLAFIFSHSLTKRIKQLILHMRKIESGNFDIEIIPHSKDEIGMLQKNFNYMLTKLSMIMDEKLELGKEIRNADLKLLQAQINPHFLYNTLDLINWKAIDKNVPEISTLVRSLAKYYRISLSSGEDIIPLSAEIEHVKTYVHIQNKRFQNRIHLEVSLQKNLYQYQVLKLLLQPLVENAIIHGLMEKNDMEGTISIDATVLDGKVLIRVIDDGIGMRQSKLEMILTSNNNKSHYGIRNIHERIILFYGSEYGLSYKSSLGVGTTVTITLPLLAQ